MIGWQRCSLIGDLLTDRLSGVPQHKENRVLGERLNTLEASHASEREHLIGQLERLKGVEEESRSHRKRVSSLEAELEASRQELERRSLERQEEQQEARAERAAMEQVRNLQLQQLHFCTSFFLFYFILLFLM